jgi:hypothetical protein
MSEFAKHYEKAKSLIDTKDIASAATILEKLIATQGTRW